jgi:hypothetical protein
MNTSAVYNIICTPAVHQFLRRLVRSDRAVVFDTLKLIAKRQILPDVVRSIDSPKTYKVNVPGSALSSQWPGGLRNFFVV